MVRAAQQPAAREGASAPPAAPDFARDVTPILEANCLRCHNTAKQEGGLLMESHADLMRGGDSGTPPIVPGQPDISPLIRQVEGHAKPKMPPKSTLRPEDVATLRGWIAAGALYSAAVRVPIDSRVPRLAQHAAVLPQVTSIAYRPDGEQMAVAGYKEVRRFSARTGAPLPPLTGLSDLVRAIAWSPDGKVIAAGGGTPGAFGEIVLFDAEAGTARATLEGHRDYVYHLAFSPDGKRLASCGYDRMIRLWDVASGKALGVLREHTEAVYAVAFSPDGTLLASGAADRSVKIWDLDTAVRLYTITEPTDAVLTLAFRPGTNELAAGGGDRRLRIWEIGPNAARAIRSAPAHSASVLRVVYSPDGRLLASTSSDREVKLWDAATGRQLSAIGPQSDWSQALAFSPDGTQIAVGRYDGTVGVFDTRTAGHLQDPIAAPAATARKVARR